MDTDLNGDGNVDLVYSIAGQPATRTPTVLLTYLLSDLLTTWYLLTYVLTWRAAGQPTKIVLGRSVDRTVDGAEWQQREEELMGLDLAGSYEPRP